MTNNEIVQALQELSRWRAALMVEHETLKAGVSNFRTFQTRGNQFFDRFEAIADASQRRSKRNMAISGLIALFLVPLTAWGCTKIVNAVMTIYEIEEQWKLAHPSEFKQGNSLFDPSGPVFANDKPQISTIPPLAR